MNRSIRPQVRRAPARPRLESLEGRRLLATFVVTNTDDSGPGSFRQAIFSANALSGTDAITFAIPGNGTHSIVPASPLPDVTDPTTIDATTQSGYAGTPLIELNGSNAGAYSNGLALMAGASTVRGLAINRFSAYGIFSSGDGNAIRADFVGTDPTGTIALGNRFGGIWIASRNNTVGGTAIGDRNVISGNDGEGLILGAVSGLAGGNRVQGNIIGADLSGTSDLGNGQDGILISTSNNLVGGAVPAAGNLIAFNGASGVQVGQYSYQPGISGNTISSNSIFGNIGLGIDLSFPGVTFNDPLDLDSGPNDLVNFPTLSSAFPSGGQLAVQGTYFGVPSATLSIQFFSNPSADPSGFGEGRTFIGSTVVTTDDSGVADLSTSLAVAVASGQFISATATDAAGNTSEFSRAIAVTASARADLAVTSSASSDTVTSGTTLTYTIAIANNGPSQASGVTLVDTLPAGATLVSARSGRGSILPTPGGIAAAIGTLASGETATVTIVVQPSTSANGTAVNVATVSGDQADPRSDNNTIALTTTVTPVIPPDLAILGTSAPNPVAVGADLSYVFVAANLSYTTTATGVTVTDALPAGLTYVSARSSQGTVTFANGRVTVALGTLTPAANATITIQVRPTVAGTLFNAANVQEDGQDPNSLNNEAVVPTLVTAAPPADLVIGIASAPDPARVGRNFTYAILVSNKGPAEATGVTVSALLTDAASVVSARASQGSATVAGPTLTGNLGNLPVGATAVITVVLRAGAPGTIETEASVTSDQPDFVIGDNDSTLTTTVLADEAPPVVVGQRLIVSGRSITRVVLTFSQALDPVLAADTANYAIEDLGTRGVAATQHGRPVPILSAVYDAPSRSVTLRFAPGLAVGRFYRLTVNGAGAPGVTDTSGNVLDGDRNGLSDGIYQSLIGRGTRSRPAALQAGVPTPKPPKPAKASHAAKPAPAARPGKTTIINIQGRKG